MNLKFVHRSLRTHVVGSQVSHTEILFQDLNKKDSNNQRAYLVDDIVFLMNNLNSRPFDFYNPGIE